MEGESSTRFCVICGVEEEDDKEGEIGLGFVKDVKLGKFCGELELSSLSLGLSDGEGKFIAYNFLLQLDKCSEFVKICGECIGLIGKTVDKRVEFEEVECEVLEMQIKLLVKLKEMEGVSKLYLREMGRVRERVKRSQLNGLEERRNIFGKGKGKCDVLGFRERILNVVTSLGMFQDNLASKLYQNRDRDKQSKIPVEKTNPVNSSPYQLRGKIPPKWNGTMNDEDNSNDDFDNLSLSSPQPPPSPDLDDDDDDPQDNLETEQTQSLEKIKTETDNLDEGEQEKELRLTQDKEDDKPKIDKRKSKTYAERRKQSRINRRNLAQVNWNGMGPLKTKLIKTILLAPDIHSDNPFKKYKWSYLIPTDQILLADDYPIQISEIEKDGFRTTTLKCISCDDAPDGFETSIKFPTDLNHAAYLHKIRRGTELLKKKFFDHVLSFHLNAFNCSKCSPEERGKFKLTTLRIFQEHQKLHMEAISTVCEICGRKFASKAGLQIHLDSHAMRQKPEEADKLKKFQCATCGSRFYQLTNLKDHEDQHKPMEMRAKVKCSFCGKEVLKRCYPVHKKHYCPQQSRTNKKMDCTICGKSYRNEKSLGDHWLRTHKMRERPKF